ncbi:MAG: tRNA pseudouridine(13) synthase TruD [Candidatus Lokiarchaeota archaeon]|nr:tRNA pseudouridine(13) synthase TruD [Candidatus Lokiarchaeota archaeon]
MLDQDINNITYSFSKNNEKEVEQFVGIENYATYKTKGFKGEYKTLYKDFIVKEIDANGKILSLKENRRSSSFSNELNDRYTTFNLTKINRDTFEAVRKLSKALNVPYSSIHYSGLKDKQAISVQKISIRGNYIKELKTLKIRDLFVRNIYPSKKPVKLGSHLGNHFTITMRNLENINNLRQRIAKSLKFLNTFGFPNYFGLQRFGTYRPNSHIVGQLILKGDYENAFKEYVSTTYSTESDESRRVRSDFRKDGDLKNAFDNFPRILKYERTMIQFLLENEKDYQGAIETLPKDLIRLLISSFQSYLFNRMLSTRVKKGISLFKPVKGDVIAILDDYNGNITKVKYIYGENYDKFVKKALKLDRATVVLPIIGSTTNLDNFPLMKTIFKDLCNIENIDTKIFISEHIDGNDFKGTIRAMTIKPHGLKMVEFTDDELKEGKIKVTIEFSLQKGSYATMLLRELNK